MYDICSNFCSSKVVYVFYHRYVKCEKIMIKG